jgi:hypothetical protein
MPETHLQGFLGTIGACKLEVVVTELWQGVITPALLVALLVAK